MEIAALRHMSEAPDRGTEALCGLQHRSILRQILGCHTGVTRSVISLKSHYMGLQLKPSGLHPPHEIAFHIKNVGSMAPAGRRLSPRAVMGARLGATSYAVSLQPSQSPFNLLSAVSSSELPAYSDIPPNGVRLYQIAWTGSDVQFVKAPWRHTDSLLGSCGGHVAGQRRPPFMSTAPRLGNPTTSCCHRAGLVTRSALCSRRHIERRGVCSVGQMM